jgi:hypothetical protein
MMATGGMTTRHDDGNGRHKDGKGQQATGGTTRRRCLDDDNDGMMMGNRKLASAAPPIRVNNQLMLIVGGGGGRQERGTIVGVRMTEKGRGGGDLVETFELQEITSLPFFLRTQEQRKDQNLFRMRPGCPAALSAP